MKTKTAEDQNPDKDSRGPEKRKISKYLLLY